MMNLMNVSMIDFVTVVDKTLSDDNYTLLNVTTTDDNSIVVLNVQKDDIKFYVPCILHSLYFTFLIFSSLVALHLWNLVRNVFYISERSPPLHPAAFFRCSL